MKRNAPDTSLRRWFPVKTESIAQSCVPSVLYLHCNADSFVEAKWYSDDDTVFPVRQRHSFVWNIQGRKGTPLTITIACGDLPPDVDTVTNPEYHLSARLNKNANSIPFLKSHLQKNIRKGNAGLAVRTCKELLQQDVLQVVRRLAVIMVEDVDLHPSFNILMWWTIALSKQASANKQNGCSDVLQAGDVPSCLLEWLLGVTHMLCTVRRRTTFDLLSTTPTIWQRVKDLHQLTTTSAVVYSNPTSSHAFVHRSIRNSLWSVMLRAAYGGLKGDIRLLQGVLTSYFQTLQQPLPPHTHTLWMTTVQPVVYHSVEPLDIDTWDLDAIDFHVARYFVQKLNEAVDDESVDVKRMMWENGSSLNVRDAGDNAKYACDIWKRVLPSVRGWQSYLLSR